MIYRGTPNLELMIRQFRCQSGLYITGAGTSAGDVELGSALMTAPARTYIQGGSFPAAIPIHSELNLALMFKPLLFVR